MFPLIFGGCDLRKEPPERFAEVGSGRFGVKLPGSLSADREVVRISEKFLTSADHLELFITPLTGVIWRIDLVIPEFPGGGELFADAKKFAAKRFLIDFGNGDELLLPGTAVRLIPAYECGVRGVRLSFTDRELAKVFASEDASPEAGEARKSRRARNDILLLEAAVEAFRRETG